MWASSKKQRDREFSSFLYNCRGESELRVFMLYHCNNNHTGACKSSCNPWMSRAFRCLHSSNNSNAWRRLSLKETSVINDLFSLKTSYNTEESKKLRFLVPIFRAAHFLRGNHYQQFSGYQSKIISMCLQNSLQDMVVKVLSYTLFHLILMKGRCIQMCEMGFMKANLLKVSQLVTSSSRTWPRAVV